MKSFPDIANALHVPDSVQMHSCDNTSAHMQLGSQGLSSGVARVDVAHAQSRSRNTIRTLDRSLPVL